MANRPIAGEDFTFTISLQSQINGQILSHPTIMPGDVRVSTDGAATTIITTTPSPNPPASGIVEVTLTAAEVGTDHFAVVFKDLIGDEWKDIYYHDVVSSASGGGGGGATAPVVLSGEIITQQLSGEIEK